MAGTMSSDFWIKPETDGRRFAAALGIGLLLELGAPRPAAAGDVA